MNSFVLTLRAIGSLLALRLYIPAVIGAGAVMALLAATTVWLTTFSDWWWLLLVPIIILFGVVLAVAAVVWLLIRYVRPNQTKSQRQAVQAFVDKIQGVTEIAGTPKFIILFRVVQSIAAPSKDRYLSDLISNKQLAGDFRELQRSFDKRT